jgi:hypothetical protein
MTNVPLNLIKVLLLALAAAVLAGCAAPAPKGPKPVVRTIDLIPATLPQYYTLQNESAVTFFVPIAGIAYGMNAKAQAKLLTEKLPAAGFSPDENLTNAVAAALREKGYEVNVLKNVQRLPGSPDSIDYAKLAHKADALAHVYFSDVGLHSPRNNTDYLSRVIVYSQVYVQSDKSWPHGASYAYGSGAQDYKEYGVAGDPSHKFSDFDDVMANLEKLRNHVNVGAKAIGQLVAERIHLDIKP